MPTKRRVNRLSPERRKADILAAAREVFAERGYTDTVMAEIAERAGVVEGSIYRYFVNKRDLMFKMAEAWFEDMIASDGGTLPSISGTRNRLRFLVHRHLISIHEEPDLSRLVFQHLRPDPDYRATKLFALNRAYTSRVVDVIKEGIAAGEIRPAVSPSLVRDVIFGCIEHRTWAFLRDERDYDPNALADQVIDLVWQGLDAGPPRPDIEPLLERLETALNGLESRR